ncbi:hypothetical protein HK099_003533 [Clydaea vesicula]|uniref:F-box domain-containing protein n=1 Tax=Clydaea vesicula TaxID=447962 RepID=A0AAD5XWA5_9FUNG|nr:hypothetical protein HK099_003533 [Clydaea vesicula]
MKWFPPTFVSYPGEFVKDALNYESAVDITFNSNIPQKHHDVLRITTYNVHMWRSPNFRTSNFFAIMSDLLPKLNTDLICLQEVPQEFAKEKSEILEALDKSSFKVFVLPGLLNLEGLKFQLANPIFSKVKLLSQKLINLRNHRTCTMTEFSLEKNVAGDFNAIESSEVINKFKDQGFKNVFDLVDNNGEKPEFTCWTGTVIDFVLIKGEALISRLNGAYLFQTSLSDHLPIDIAIEHGLVLMKEFKFKSKNELVCENPDISTNKNYENLIINNKAEKLHNSSMQVTYNSGYIKSRTIETLFPNEILNLIFDKLEKFDLVLCSLVNKRWSRLTKDAIWKNFRIKNLTSFFNLMLKLQYDFKFESSFNKKIQNHSSSKNNLPEHYLNDVNTYNKIVSLANITKGITITVDNFFVADSLKLSSYFKNLTFFQNSASEWFDLNSLLTVLRNCPKLIELELRGINFVKEIEEENKKVKLNNLKSLLWTCSQGDPCSFFINQSLESLERLYFPFESQDLFNLLFKNLCNLKVLLFDISDSMDIIEIDNLLEFIFIHTPKLVDILVFGIRDKTKISRKVFEAIIKHSKLTGIRLVNFIQVFALEDFEWFLENFGSNLKIFQFETINFKLNNDFLKIFLNKNLKNLLKFGFNFKVKKEYKISIEIIERICQELPKLVRFYGDNFNEASRNKFAEFGVNANPLFIRSDDEIWDLDKLSGFEERKKKFQNSYL